MFYVLIVAIEFLLSILLVILLVRHNNRKA